MYAATLEKVTKVPVYYLLIVVAVICIANYIVRKMVRYHWDEYGYDEVLKKQAQKRLIGTSNILIAVMVISLIIYYLS